MVANPLPYFAYEKTTAADKIDWPAFSIHIFHRLEPA